MTSSALDGLVVVEVSGTLTGTIVSGFLADFGAHVTIVEPLDGSPLRSERAWPFWGRGKHSCLIDLDEAKGRDELARLAADADVVVETLRPGSAEAMGLKYRDLAQNNPGLVYASVTGFGCENPWSRFKAYEPVVMAKTGGLTAFGNLTSRDGPAFVSTPYCSFSAAQLALHGILAALIERESSGVGQRVETTLSQGLLAHDPWNWLLKALVDRFDQAFLSAPPFDEKNLAPNSHMMLRLMVGLSADGRWMQFSQSTDKLWSAFLRLAGLEWTLDDPRLGGWADSDDPKVRADFWEAALAAVRTRTYAEWLEAFDEDTDVWAEVFREGTELLHHPQLRADGRTTTIEDPDVGDVHQPGPLVILASAPSNPSRPAPAPGQYELPPRSRRWTLPEPQQPPSPASEPLAGVTVVEFGTFFAAPYGATLLGELGARIIKIEQLEGDPIRHVMPFPEISGIKVMSGKESVAVDVATPDGHEIAMEIVRAADIVLLAFRANVAERLGIAPHMLRSVNPELVVLEATGYGPGDPHGHRPAFAPTMGAGSGLAYRNLGGAPRGQAALDLSVDDVKREAIRLSAAAMAVAQADGFSALAVASSMLLGQLVKRRTGRGQTMVTSMLATMGHVLSETMVEYQDAPPVATPDLDLLGLGPWYRLYECAPGWVFLAAVDDADRRVVADELKIEVGEASRDEIASMLAAEFRKAGALDWEQRLLERDVTCVEVSEESTDSTMMYGEPGRSLGFVIDGTHPVLGDHPRLAPLVAFSRSTTRVGIAPLCGQDTDAVLREFGFDQDRIAELREAGTIG